MISSSELAYVLLNDKSYRLGPKPTPITTDSSGSVHVVVETDDTHGCPILHLTVQGKGQSKTINVDPRQRITSQWSKYTSGADLKNAKSTTGEPIFADTTIPDQTFNDIALTLQEVSKVLLTQHSNETSTTFHSNSNARSYGMGMLGSANIFIFPDVLDGMRLVGDLIFLSPEGCIRTAALITQSGISIDDGIVNFVATVGGKLFRWALDAAETIVTAYVSRRLLCRMDRN
jgi:hypothetical protein